MTNLELEREFQNIMTLDNSFNRLFAINALKKDYKKSEFYKSTKLDIFSAYELFVKDVLVYGIFKIKSFLTPERLGDYLTDLADNIQPDAIEKLTNSIIESLKLDDIMSSTQELGEIVQRLKH